VTRSRRNLAINTAAGLVAVIVIAALVVLAGHDEDRDDRTEAQFRSHPAVRRGLGLERAAQRHGGGDTELGVARRSPRQRGVSGR
jgi:hypothetical protein